jgi:uncharacterized protein
VALRSWSRDESECGRETAEMDEVEASAGTGSAPASYSLPSSRSSSLRLHSSAKVSPCEIDGRALLWSPVGVESHRLPWRAVCVRSIGAIYYELQGDTIAVDHTEIGSASKGRGVARSSLAGPSTTCAAVASASYPSAPFVRSYIARHGEYLDLVPEKQRAAFGL